MKADLDVMKAVYKKANRMYNNTGKMIMSDAEFDKLERSIRSLDPDWEGLSATGAPVVNKKVAVPLARPMPSLAKIYPEHLDAWRKKQTASKWLAMHKLDGSALQGRCHNRVWTQLVTRGDGTTGKDISFLIPFLKLPKIKEGGEHYVRFEAVMTEQRFAKYKRKNKDDKDGFDNARALVNGVLNRRTEHAAMQDIDIICLGVYGKPMEEGLNWADGQGLHTVVRYVCKTSADFEKLLVSARESSAYAIDGLVLAPQQRLFFYESADRPKWTVAFKVNAEDAAYQTTVKSVVWRLSRTRRWMPKIKVVPVDMGDCVVTYATAHNAKWLTERGLGKGAVIKLVRSGDVIPKIVEVVKKGEVSTPPGDYVMKGVHFVSVEASKDSEVHAVHHFMTVLGIENIARKSLDKLHDAGITTVLDHLMSYGKRMKGYASAGIGEAATKKVYAEFTRVFKTEGVPLLKLMVASNCFESLGERKLRAIEVYYMKLGDGDPLRAFVKMDKVRLKRVQSRLTRVPGVGDAVAAQFVEGLIKFRAWLREVAATKLVVIRGPVPLKSLKKSGDLDGQYVTFTGYRDSDHVKHAEERGAEIIDFGTRTTILVYKEGKMNSKIEKAKDKGVRVCTFDKL